MTSAAARARSWAGPLAVTALGGWLRFADLAAPHAFVFDETYYAKDGYSLLEHGYELAAVKDANEQILAGTNFDVFTSNPSFIVHPPLGKWIIASGEAVFGLTPFGWRFGLAVLGTIAILVLARATRRLTGSTLWGTVAGLLLAVDGLAIVTSRTAVLDGMLMFFVLAAFALLLIDRDRSRSGGFSGHWWRPWRLAAAVALGLACGVKWSGIWYVAAFGLLTVVWDVSHRHRRGERTFRALVRDSVPAAITIVGGALLVYILAWAGWFASDAAWSRTWADGGGPINALRSLWHYHGEMWSFHNNLTSDHGYESSAFGWLVQARPTSFYYEGSDSGCPSGSCTSAVTALGNPVIWWASVLALLHQIWRWWSHRDWRSAAVLTGVAAGWVPWLVFPDRTIFSFYSIVFAPFLIMAITLSLATIANPDPLARRTDQRARIVIVAGFLLACVGVSWFFYPVWSAGVIDQTSWSQRMWLPSWV